MSNLERKLWRESILARPPKTAYVEAAKIKTDLPLCFNGNNFSSFLKTDEFEDE